MLSPDILKAIEICLELNIPFVAYSLPGKKEIEFFANPSSTGENKAKLDGRHEFIINYFNNEYLTQKNISETKNQKFFHGHIALIAYNTMVKYMS